MGCGPSVHRDAGESQTSLGGQGIQRLVGSGTGGQILTGAYDTIPGMAAAAYALRPGAAPSSGRTLESFRPEAEAILGARSGQSRIRVMKDPGVRGSLNPTQDNIIYREYKLSRLQIEDTKPFNQALSDNGGQPIRVVVTQGGEKYIMQGNHRIYGAREQRLQNVEAIIYTPEQWEVLTESPFVPRGTNNPAIGP
jgi:hypothetical protein